MKKSILSFCLTATIAICGNVLHCYAYSNDASTYSDMVKFTITQNNMGDVLEQRELYDSNNEVVATCLEFNNAYLIYLNNGTVMEYSLTTNSDYYKKNEICYYSGPLHYYEKTNEGILDMSTDTIVTEKTIAKNEKVISDIEEIEIDNKATKRFRNNLKSANSAKSSHVAIPSNNIYKLPDDPITIDYNDNNSCAAIAMEIVLAYFNSHTTKEYIPINFGSDYYYFYYYLLMNYFKSDHGDYSTTTESLKNTIDNYCANHNLNNSTYWFNTNNCTFYSEVYSSIAILRRPAIINLYDNPESISSWSLNHFVVCYGMTDPSIYGQYHYFFMLVNDGWGNNNRYIFYSPAYVRDIIRFKKAK